MTPTRRVLSLTAAWFVCVAASAATGQTGSTVAATKHNLTSTGPGTVKTAAGGAVCRFCHTPHSANPIAPLWNRADPGTYYQTYESTTLVAEVGQPTGSSRLCLSCHDGTIALTQTYNPRNAPTGSIYITSKDRGYIGTDLSDDHPISFVYDSGLAVRAGQLSDPATLPRTLALDDRKELQCTTCHDPHNDQFGNFLTMSNAESRMCRSCHAVSGWTASAHATSSASLSRSSRDRWDNLKAATVREAACEACHRPHNAGGRQRLLRHEAEEDNCLNCHDGSVASRDVAADLAKLSAHRVGATTGVHDPAESAATMAKHVECGDCHDPHESSGGAATQPPFVKHGMQGASGLTDSGAPLAQATYEYQVCYKCHSIRPTVEPYVERVSAETNIAAKLAPTNPSYHPVQAQGRGSNVPSLLQPLKTTSLVYCTDCHRSEAAGALGPHGSAYRPLLIRAYALDDFTRESPQAYALCYGCHNRQSILGNQSFSEHKKHVEGKQTPCSACHDPHGVRTQSMDDSGTHMINFDRRIVLPSKKAAPGAQGPSYVDRGMARGSCTLLCHKKDHVNTAYPH